MGLISFIGRVFVVVVNLVFLLVGVALFAGGMFLRFGRSFTEKWVDVAEQQLTKTISSTGIGTTDGVELDMNELLLTISIVLIAIGFVLMAMTFLGCCGACYKIKCLLKTYVSACVVLLLAEIVIVCLVFAAAVIRDAIKTGLKEGIHHDSQGYSGLAGTNLVSIAWNILMIEGNCCGIDNYEDFTDAPLWNITTQYGNLETPIVCCKTLPSTHVDITCAVTGTADDTNNNRNTGCFEKYWNWTLGNTSIVIPVLVAVGVFQLLLIIFGVVVMKSDENNAKNKTAPEPVQPRGYRQNRW